MKLKAQVGDREEDLIVNIDEGRVSAEIAGRVYDLQVRQPSPDSYLFFMGRHAVFECRFHERSRDVFDVDIHGRRYKVTIVDPKRLRSGLNSDRHHHGVAEIRAPMPGKVVRVQIESGASVEKGQGLVVVEAMKMQNEMKSPRDGVVVSIKVKAGETVNAGDVLAVVE